MHSVEGTFTTCININAPDQISSCQIFLECWWRKLAKNQRSLPAFFLGPKAHVHDPVHVLLVGLNHMHGPMQNFLVCFGAPKLYAFPICKCYAFLNILLGYPLCLTTTHKYIYIYSRIYSWLITWNLWFPTTFPPWDPPPPLGFPGCPLHRVSPQALRRGGRRGRRHGRDGTAAALAVHLVSPAFGTRRCHMMPYPIGSMYGNIYHI